MQVKFTLMHENARLPERGHGIDVGLDTFTSEAGVLRPGPNKIPLGFGMDVPVGYSASIYPRSGMASGEKTVDFEVVIKQSNPVASLEKVTVKDFKPEGVPILAQIPPIDPGYKGQVHAIVINLSDLYIKYPAHTRFGQLVCHPITYINPTVEDIDMSRGTGGFGSTGVANERDGHPGIVVGYNFKEGK